MQGPHALTPTGSRRLDVGTTVKLVNADGSGKDYVSFHWIIASPKKTGALGDIGRIALSMSEGDVMGRKVTFLDVALSIRDQGWKSDITHVVEIHAAYGLVASFDFHGPSFFHSPNWNGSGQRLAVSPALRGIDIQRVDWFCSGDVWNS